MYADKLTEAIKGALDETNRRRVTQLAYNEEHGITPRVDRQGVSDIAEFLTLEQPHVPSSPPQEGKRKVEGLSREELEKLSSSSRRRCSSPPRSCGSSTRRSCGTRSRTSAAS